MWNVIPNFRSNIPYRAPCSKGIKTR